MELTKLKEGMTVKNYPELCELLGVEQKKGGRNKKYHLEELEMYFDYEKIGHKFIINHLYDEPLYTINNTTYTDLIRDLLLNFLSRRYKQKGNRYSYFTINQLLHELWMVNSKFKNYYKHQEDFAELLNIDIEYIKDFYQNDSNKLARVLDRALKKLENEFIIRYDKVFMINMTDRDGIINRSATDQEELIIIDLHKQVCNELDCKNEIELQYKKKQYLFDSMVNDRLEIKLQELYRDNNLYLNYKYKAYHIRFITNIQNRRMDMKSLTGHIGVQGVGWTIPFTKWRATITVNGKSKSLGVFTDIDEAIESRRQAEIKYYGEYRDKERYKKDRE